MHPKYSDLCVKCLPECSDNLNPPKTYSCIWLKANTLHHRHILPNTGEIQTMPINLQLENEGKEMLISYMGFTSVNI